MKEWVSNHPTWHATTPRPKELTPMLKHHHPPFIRTFLRFSVKRPPNFGVPLVKCNYLAPQQDKFTNQSIFEIYSSSATDPSWMVLNDSHFIHDLCEGLHTVPNNTYVASHGTTASIFEIRPKPWKLSTGNFWCLTKLWAKVWAHSQHVMRCEC